MNTREPDAWALMDGDTIVTVTHSKIYAESLAKNVRATGGLRYHLEPLYREGKFGTTTIGRTPTGDA